MPLSPASTGFRSVSSPAAASATARRAAWRGASSVNEGKAAEKWSTKVLVVDVVMK